MTNTKKVTAATANSIADKILSLKTQIEMLGDKKHKLEIAHEDLRSQMLGALKELDLQGIKRGDYHINIAKRWAVNIWNDDKVVAEIKARNIEHAIEERITPYFRMSIAPALAKQGVTLDGMDVAQTEMLVVSKGERYVPKDGKYPKQLSKAGIRRMMKE